MSAHTEEVERLHTHRVELIDVLRQMDTDAGPRLGDDAADYIEALLAEVAAFRDDVKILVARRKKWCPAGSLPFSLATALDKIEQTLDTGLVP